MRELIPIALALSATGLVTGNVVSENHIGMTIGAGSTVIGNVSTYNTVGMQVTCPSNVTDNTVIHNPPNSDNSGLILSRTGCNNTNNVAL
jgi:hypothetical protein